MSSSRLLHVDMVRGVAALAVVWHHLTGASGLSESTASLGEYGYLGVEAFFVISGFIIPYSMTQKGYRLGDFPLFIAKRVVRLDPPYLAALACGVALSAVAQGAAYRWPSVWQLAAHLGYANAVVGLEWLSPVFWTLAIEFQFYLVMGVAFSLVAHKGHRPALIFLTACALLPLITPSRAFLPHWSGLFVLGALAFRRRAYDAPIGPLLGVGAIAAAVTFKAAGVAEAVTGLLATAAISWLNVSHVTRWNRPLLWLGTVSYSLYLIHWDFGRTGVAISRHLPVLGSSELARVFIGLGSALVSAWVFYLAVEKPAIGWPSRIGRTRHGARGRVKLASPDATVTEAETW